MSKRKKSLKPVRGFGPLSQAEEQRMAMQAVLMVAFKLSLEKLAELDRTKNLQEWRDWAMEESANLIKSVNSQSELDDLLEI